MTILVSNVPQDIVYDILSLCPVKSLLRFKTVSKLWLSIISNPQFIQSHGLIAAKKKPSIVVNQILHATPKNFGFEYIFISTLFPAPCRIISSWPCRLIGSCHGIVCLVKIVGYIRDPIYLWNPSTKHYMKVPDHKEYPQKVDDRILGFGYDSIYSDYKIICLETQCDDYEKKLVQIFSTNSGSWSEITLHIQLPHNLYNRYGPVVNGPVINNFLYFQAREYDIEEKYKLISFDFHNELFGQVPLPSCMQEIRSNILDFEGSPAIVVINYIGESDNEEISLWSLDINGSEVSWIKKLIIETNNQSWMKIRHHRFDQGLWIDLYMGDGQFYGRNYIEHYSPLYHIVSHIWYDYKKKKGNCFDLQEYEFPGVMKYTESLASIKGFESTGWKKKSSRASRRRRRRA